MGNWPRNVNLTKTSLGRGGLGGIPRVGVVLGRVVLHRGRRSRELIAQGDIFLRETSLDTEFRKGIVQKSIPLGTIGGNRASHKKVALRTAS